MLTTGQRIRNLRKSRKLTQESLAEMIGVDELTISRWERDQRLPNTENLFKLSSLFGLSAGYILKGSDPDER